MRKPLVVVTSFAVAWTLVAAPGPAAGQPADATPAGACAASSPA